MNNTIICKECRCKNNGKNIYCSNCGADLYKKNKILKKTSHKEEIILSMITLLLFVINGLIIIFMWNKPNFKLLKSIITIFQCVSSVVFISLTIIGFKKYPNNAVFKTIIELLIIIVVLNFFTFWETIVDYIIEIANKVR